MKRALLVGGPLAVLLLILWMFTGGDYLKLADEAFERAQWRRAATYYRVAAGERALAPDRELQRGTALTYSGVADLEEAEAVLAPLESHEELGPRATLQRVQALVLYERAEKAISVAEAALARWGDHPLRREALADARRGLMDQALGDVDRFWAKNSSEDTYRVARGRMDRLVAIDDAEFATAFEREYMAIAKEPPGPRGAELRKLLEIVRSRRAEAEAAALTALAANPQAFRSAALLCQQCAGREDADGALLHARIVLEFDEAALPDRERRIGIEAARRQVLASLGGVLEGAKRVPEGIALLEATRDRIRSRTAVNDRLGRLYYVSKEWQKLLDLAREWQRREPGNIMASFYRGAALLGTGDAEAAIPHLERAVAADNNSYAFHRELGAALSKVGNIQRAVPSLDRASRQNPWDADSLLLYAQGMNALGEPTLARIRLREALESRFADPNLPQHRMLASYLDELYMATGTGLDDLDRARELHIFEPSNPYVALRLAQLETDAGDWREGLSLARTVTERYPRLAQGWAVLARIAFDNAQWDVCRSALTRLEILRPDDASVPYMRGCMMMNARRYAEARELLDLAALRDPLLSAVKLAQMDLELQERRPEAAILIGERLLEAHPGHPEVHRRLAQAHNLRGEREHALESIRSVLAVPDHDPGLAFLLEAAQVLREAGDGAAASRALQRASEAGRGSIGLAIQVAEQRIAERDYDGVIQVLSPLLPQFKSPDERRRAAGLLARAQNYSGRRLDALRTLGRVRNDIPGPEELLVIFAFESGAHPEAARIGRLRDVQAGLGATGALFSARALLATGDAATAIPILARAQTLAADRENEILLLLAVAHALAGDQEASLGALRRNRDRGNAPELRRSGEAILRAFIATDPAAALDAARFLAAKPDLDPNLLLSCHRAAVAAGEPATGQAWLRAALGRDPNGVLAATVAGIQLLARADADAAEVLAAASGSHAALRTVRDAARVLRGEDPEQADGFPALVAALRSGDLEGARRVRLRLREIDELHRADLASLVDDWPAGPPGRDSILDRYLRALAAGTTQGDPASADRLLRNLAKEWPAAAPAFVAARLRIALDAPLPGLLRDAVADPSGNPETRLFAARLGIHAGAGPALEASARALEPGEGQVPSARFARELAIQLSLRHLGAEAAAVLSGSEPAPAPEYPEIITWVQSGAIPRAAEAALGLPEARRAAVPLFEALALLGEASLPEPPANLGQRRRSFLADRGRTDRVPPMLVLQLALSDPAADLRAAVAQFFERAPYQSWALKAALDLVSGRRDARPLSAELQETLDLLDPDGNLRGLLPRDRTRTFY
jgi:predicted Zn-dependent protease